MKLRRRAQWPRFFALGVLAIALMGMLLSGCKQEPSAPPLSALSPKPLPTVPPPSAAAPAPPAADEREAAFEVVPAPVFGDSVPKGAARVELLGEKVLIDGAPFDPTAKDAADRLRALFPEGREALLVPDPETYLMQVSPLFAALDDARVRTHLLHPDGSVSFRVTLSDERDFGIWLDQPRAGQIRVIHRADGFELQSNLGKLPGADPNGPSVPLRGGQWDVARLRSGVAVLKERFDADTESCIVPSFGMELANVSRALTAYYSKPGSRLFPELCLVYPRRDAPSPAPAPSPDAAK